MKRPAIGFLIPRLGITDRGAEVFVYELAKRLKRDFEITIWVRKSGKKSTILSDLEERGVIIKRISCLSAKIYIFRLPYSLPFLRKTIDTFHMNPNELEMLSFSIACLPRLIFKKVDLLFPANGIWGSLICRFIRAIKDTPFVYATLGGMQPLIARQKPNVYVSLFPSITQWLKTNFPKLKVTFIPSGVDLKKFIPIGENARINLPRPIFITVSALVPEKQVDLTIKAVAKLKKGSLLVVGDGQLKHYLVQLADKLLGKERFQFVGVEHSELPKYYRAADVFAFSAPWEVGWSIVHLEALASGLPVVANREENLEYLLGKDWPLFCNVKDADDYSRALIKATKIKIDGIKLIKDYSWDKIVKRYKEVLMSVIKSKI